VESPGHRCLSPKVKKGEPSPASMVATTSRSRGFELVQEGLGRVELGSPLGGDHCSAPVDQGHSLWNLAQWDDLMGARWIVASAIDL
jgi:hypothetical protein